MLSHELNKHFYLFYYTAICLSFYSNLFAKHFTIFKFLTTMWIYNIYAFRVGHNQVRTVQSGIGMRWKIEI